MTSLREIVNDPIIQLLIIVIVAIGVFDTFKFVMSWVWRKIGGKGEDG